MARQIAPVRPEIVCGPLVEGTFVAMQVATELGLEFAYSERSVNPDDPGLYPVRYRIPGELRRVVSGRRVAIVNDVISAGSAVRGTLEDLRECSAVPVALGSLLVLGSDPQQLADAASIPLAALTRRDNTLYEPDECPMCKAGEALVPHPGS